MSVPTDQPAIIERQHFQRLIDALIRKGYRVIGPVVRDDAIVYDELTALEDLPQGWTDEQDGGVYRLKRRTDNALFGYAVGPHSWKKFLHPPHLRLWQARRNADGTEFTAETEPPPRFAFIGVRSCELHAIAIQDKVFLQGSYVDPTYQARREQAFIVAVNCGQAGGTCFCVSMNTGPQATFGFDLALTEVIESDRHYFVAEAGTERGAELLREISAREADDDERRQAAQTVARAAQQMGRTMDTHDIRALLYRNHEHPRWNDVASRCLACANCTMVCPTCFCTTVEDTTNLTGEHAERWRRWDSCFTLDFSYIHGGSVRVSTKARYRQWMTHKLASWIDQFGTSGCVGCGRCITWCPVGIDITEEVRAIRESEAEQ
ncbi:MAG: 4Fe-4S dicluster domain-containing protein [Acidobacteriota bacterium]|nr:4Fe-4S dicluster domain-containing protein [Acidobacteriota bacterium]